MTDRRLGVLGATSLVGECLFSVQSRDRWQVIAFSRQPVNSASVDLQWRQVPAPGAESVNDAISYWICLAPIWVLPEHFALLEATNARRVVALSSTSRFSKNDSTDPGEQRTADRLAEGEAALRNWAEARGVEWIILRPTLIYGLGRDHNISEIARFIRRFRCFPLLGPADGLRQPVHARDVAGACLAAMTAGVANRAYDLSGADMLSYRAMVERVFAALGQSPRLITIPRRPFRLAVTLLRQLPRYRHWTAAMVERMNRDLVFDHSDAARDFGFFPQRFQLDRGDLPR